MMAERDVVIHPAPVEELPSDDYTVTVNGEPVFVHRARVSAHPLNQVWPGYQRPLDQTETAAFATWDMAGPVDVVVVSARPVGEVLVRPSSRGILPEVDGNRISFTLAAAGQVTVEVNGMRRALHLFANPPETDAPESGARNVRYFGPGVHCPGLMRVTGGETVYLAGGAVVYGAIIAENVENVVIRGRGILDGSKFCRGDVHALISTVGCGNVTVEGIVLRDPPSWTLVPAVSRNVHIRNVKLVGLWRYNADGIDFVNCRDCSVEDSFVRAFDDCIVFKGLERWAGTECFGAPVADIQVRRCVIWCDWGRALEIGAETVADEICNLLFEDCDIIHSMDVAMELQNGDRAHCHNLLFSNIRVELDDDQTRPAFQEREGQVYDVTARNLSQLIVLVVSQNMWSKDTVRGRIDGIRFRDIEVTAWATPEIYLAGCDAEHTVDNVSIENLRINGGRIGSVEEGRFTIRPFVGGLTV